MKRLHFVSDNPQAKIVAGATDVGVQLNKRVIEPTVFLDLNRVMELEGVKVEEADGERARLLPARGRLGQNCLDVCREAKCRSLPKSCRCSARRRFGTLARSAAISSMPRQSPIRCRFCS